MGLPTVLDRKVWEYVRQHDYNLSSSKLRLMYAC